MSTNKFKIGFFDLDGTLLHSGSLLNNFNKKALGLLHEKKIEIVVATGRDLAGVKFLFDLVPVRYYILNNSAVIYDAKENKILETASLKMKDIRGIVDYLSKKKLAYYLYTEKGIFGKRINFLFKLIALKFHYELQPLLSDLYNDDNLNVYKIYIPRILLPNAELTKYVKSLEDRFQIFEFRYGWTLNLKNTNKSVGVNYILKLLKIKKAEAFGCGDSYNDIDLAKSCGYFVAMSDSPQKLIDCADKVATPIKSGGLLYAIEKWILNRNKSESE